MWFDWPKSDAPKCAKSLVKVLSAYEETCMYSPSTAFFLFVWNLNCVKTITEVSLRYWCILRKACILNGLFEAFFDKWFPWKMYLPKYIRNSSWCPQRSIERSCWFSRVWIGSAWLCESIFPKAFYKGSPSNSTCMLMCLFQGNLDDKHNKKV